MAGVKRRDLLEEEKLEAVLEGVRLEGACDIDKVEVAALARYFWAYDEDESGCLGASELTKLLQDMRGVYSAAEVESILLRIDSSKNGVVEFPEFVRWWTGLTDHQHQVESSFDRLLKVCSSDYRKDEIAHRIYLYVEQCEHGQERAWRFSVECARPVNLLEFRLNLSESSGISIDRKFDQKRSHGLKSFEAGCLARPFEICLLADLKSVENSTEFRMHYNLSWRELDEDASSLHKASECKTAPDQLIIREEEESILRPWLSCIVWRRPDENAILFDAKHMPEPTDVREGLLRSEWLSATMAALAERYDLLRNIFQEDKRVRLFLDGVQRFVEIDTSFPCTQWSNRCVFAASASPRKLWVQLLEKAVAELFGSYISLEFGHAVEGLALCTGLPCEAVRLADARVDPDDLWHTLQSWIVHDRALVTLATVGGDLSRIGEISDGRGYAVLDISSSNNERLILLRDAWSYGFIPEALQEESTTSFWIEWEALFSRFEVLSACFPHLNSSRRSARLSLDASSHSCAAIDLEVTQETELFLSVHQPQQRGTNAVCSLVDLGLLLLRKDHVLGGVFPCLEACVSTGRLVEIPPGHYTILVWTTALAEIISKTNTVKKLSLTAARRAAAEIRTRCRDLDTGLVDTRRVLPGSREPLTEWLLDHPERLSSLGYDQDGYLRSQRSVVVVAHASTAECLRLKATKWKAADHLETTVAAAVKALGRATPHPDHCFCIYTMTNGGNGVSFAVENMAIDSDLHFTMDCSKANNALSHRGTLLASDTIEPSQVKLIHHLAPAGPGTWSWSYECQWTHHTILTDDENSPEAIMVQENVSSYSSSASSSPRGAVLPTLNDNYMSILSPLQKNHQEYSPGPDIIDLDDQAAAASFVDDEFSEAKVEALDFFDDQSSSTQEILDDSFEDDSMIDPPRTPLVIRQDTMDDLHQEQDTDTYDDDDVLEIVHAVEEVSDDGYSFDEYDIPEVPMP